MRVKTIAPILAVAALLSTSAFHFAFGESSEPVARPALPVDGSFELDGSAWAFNSGVKVTDEVATDGKKSLQVVREGREANGNTFATQTLAVTPESTLTLTYQVKTNEVDGSTFGAGVWIEFYTDGAEKKYIKSVYPTAVAGTKEWRAVELKFVVPAGATSGLVYAGLHSSSGEAWFDDIRLQ